MPMARPTQPEFVGLAGETIALVTLPADAVRAVEKGEIAHARKVA